jgi:glycosyltransferase involved in cell wall biosynthesis
MNRAVDRDIGRDMSRDIGHDASRAMSPARALAAEPPRCAIVTNIPAPYRNPVYARLPQDRFVVVFCARTEGNRQWRLEEPRFAHRFLSARPARAKADGWNFVHNNPDVWSVLNALRPSVVVTNGFNPTHLYAFAWARAHGARHVCMTDGTVASEAGLTWKHRLVRRIVFSASRGFVAASRSGMRLFRGYGVPPDAIFQSHLCADNERFAQLADPPDRPFDVMFAGQLHERKLPFLFVDVCAALRRRRGHCRALVIGDGPLRQEILERLARAGVDCHYPGFVQQPELPGWYARARLLLFTTRLDPWGVVANEAMAAGTPVITTPHAGVADELVIDGLTGFVRPPDADAWADCAAAVLDDPERWAELSGAARRQVAAYTYDAAAAGIVAACDHAARH